PPPGLRPGGGDGGLGEGAGAGGGGGVAVDGGGGEGGGDPELGVGGGGGGGGDGAVDQDLELGGEDGGVVGARRLGQVFQELAQGQAVLEDPGLGRVVGVAAQLGGGVGHERAAEPGLGEPGLELVPEAVEAVRWVVAAAVHGVRQAVQPGGAPLLDGGRDQGVLAAELAVEGHRGHVGLADDA